MVTCVMLLEVKKKYIFILERLRLSTNFVSMCSFFLESTCKIFFYFSESYTTAPAPPYVYPLQVGGGGGKVGDLVMTWEPLPIWDQNGEGICYIVQWKKKFLIDEEWSTVSFLKKYFKIQYIFD